MLNELIYIYEHSVVVKFLEYVKNFCKLGNLKVFYDNILKLQEDFYYGKQKKEVYKLKPMTEGKKNLIQGMLQG